MATRKESSSTSAMFHAFKRAVFSPSSPTADEDFNHAVHNFKLLHSHLLNIRSHLNTFTTSTKSLLHSSFAVANDFADLMSDVPRPHPYANMMQDMKRAHGDISGEKGEAAISKLIDDTTQRRLNDEFSSHTRLFQRIEERNKLRADYDYYTKKVGELKVDREKRAAKGKPEGKADIEKWDRNQTKFNEAKEKYEAFHQELMAELTSTYEHRLGTYGPAMSEFLSVELMLMTVYTAALKEIAPPDATQRVVDGAGKPRETISEQKYENAGVNVTPSAPPADASPVPVSAPASVAHKDNEGYSDPFASNPAPAPVEGRPSNAAPPQATPPFVVQATPSMGAPNAISLGGPAKPASNPFGDDDSD